jgi:hypothetical protein
VNISGILGWQGTANLLEIGLVVGMVVRGGVFSAKGIIHRPVRVAVHDCAANFGESDGASCIAHCDNG